MHRSQAGGSSPPLLRARTSEWREPGCFSASPPGVVVAAVVSGSTFAGGITCCCGCLPWLIVFDCRSGTQSPVGGGSANDAN